MRSCARTFQCSPMVGTKIPRITMLTSGAVVGILLLAGVSEALPSAGLLSVRAPGLRAGGCERALHLALRGGADAGSNLPSYSSPAAAAVNWDEPAADIPPAPQSHAGIPPAPQMAPPKAPPPPPAPAYQAPPPPAPAPDSVAWDQSSVSTFRRYIDMFGWENISPVLYLAAGLGYASIQAWWHDGGDDDDDSIGATRAGRGR